MQIQKHILEIAADPGYRNFLFLQLPQRTSKCTAFYIQRNCPKMHALFHLGIRRQKRIQLLLRLRVHHGNMHFLIQTDRPGGQHLLGQPGGNIIEPEMQHMRRTAGSGNRLRAFCGMPFQTLQRNRIQRRFLVLQKALRHHFRNVKKRISR